MVIEVVVFRTRRDVAEADFLRAAAATNTFLSRCEGFIRGRLARNDAGEWIDYIEWRTMAEALAAATRFKDAPETVRFNQAIDAESIIVRHLTVRLQRGSDDA
jgi:heme-degrading monooxygenase HmoA